VSVAAAAILAGGRGRRLGGVCKPLLVVDGLTIVQRQLEVLLPRVPEVLLLVADLASWQDWSGPARLVVDDEPGQGPLGGLATALRITGGSVLLVAGDLPHLSPALVDALLCDEGEGDGDGGDSHDPDPDAVVPRPHGRPQPLCARYSPRTLSPLLRRLAAQQRRAVELLTELRVRWIDDAELAALDPDGRALTNLNTPADLDLDARGPMR